MGKVINFNGVTTGDLDPDAVLQAAIGEMGGVVILGYDKQGFNYFASSIADGAEVNFLLDVMKKELLELGS